MKKMNNKGFSLVELIIVIAIMAILIAVLAPQYLRYVEKSRLQSDNSAIGEVANAVKIAAADDAINSAIQNNSGSDTIKIPKAGGAPTCTVSALQTEGQNVCGSTIEIKSNSYKKMSPTDIEVIVSIDGNGVAVVTGNNYIADVTNNTPTTIDF